MSKLRSTLIKAKLTYTPKGEGGLHTKMTGVFVIPLRGLKSGFRTVYSESFCGTF